MSGPRHTGALLAFIGILLLFLVVQDAIVIVQQRKMLMTAAQVHFEREMDLLAASSYEAVLKQDYVNVRSFVNRWGNAHEEYLTIRATAPNGFLIAEYKRPSRDDIPAYTFSKVVTDGSRELITIELSGDYRETEKIVSVLRTRLIAGSLLYTAVLGWALWYAVKTRALVPLEAEVSIRKHSEELLEAKVRERTVELEIELAERRRIEEELIEREERIRLLLNSTAEAIYGVDTSGNCTFCNPSCLRILGFERPEDLIGRNMHKLIHHTRPNGLSYAEEECLIYSAYREQRGCHADNELFWRADGSSFPVEYWSYPITRGDSVIGAVVTFIDISERKRLEEQLLHSQKMQAVGRLAGGIAHDFNNILTAIVGYASILRSKITDQKLNSHAVLILDASQRATQLIQSLLAFGRKQIMTFKPLNLNDVIMNVGKLLVRIIGADIALKMELTSADLSVMADASQIEQLLMNLSTNARDAMPSGGQLTIRSERFEVRPGLIRGYGPEHSGPYALITVIDTGVGMDQNIREKMFEPFFTTKDVGKGTGLGLSIVYAVVKQHNGFVDVTSEPGEGSIFRVYLPLIQTKPRPEERAQEVKELPRGTETILLAEDDAAIRALTTSVLEEAGYQVIAAADGEDAIQLFRERMDAIDLALLDVVMPKVNGRDVYDEMKKAKPSMKVLFASGYAGDLLSIQGIINEGYHFIQKPMTPEDLARKVRSVLDSSA